MSVSLLDAAKLLEVVEELLALVALRLAVLHRIAAQIVVQLHRFDGGRSRLVLKPDCMSDVTLMLFKS